MVAPIQYEGSNCLRQRLILATLTGRPIVISKIRLSGDEPGLAEYEFNLLKLIEKLTNGSVFEVDESGTRLSYSPGLLIGGTIQHDCGLGRSMSYYLEVVLCFAPFCKHPLEATFQGITNDSIDPGVDTLKHSLVPLLKKMLRVLDPTEIELKVISRGMKPDGGGAVFFKCPIRKNVRPIQWTGIGKIKRIRGVAFATRVSPQIANRIVEISKGLLLQFIPDVYIHTDHLKGKHSGKSPGFGLCLYAETTEGAVFTGEAVSNPSGSELGPSVPEDVAKEATHALFEEIYRGGCVDSVGQGLATLFMALGDNDLSKIILGPLSPYTIHLMRHMKDLLSVTFKLDADSDQGDLKKGATKIVATCIGTGFTNLSKTIT